MIEAVSDIIAARSQPSEGLRNMVLVSIAVHAAALTGLLLAPRPDFSDDVPKTVMTISLGGAPGPRAGGMTPMGGRAVQAPPPAEPEPRRAETPPAPKAPEMTIPTKGARTRPQARPNAAPQDASGSTPTTGPEVREGSARVDTGARGLGFGLTTGGGGGTGAQLDVGDFCCPEYLETMHQRIQQNWAKNQNVTGQVVVRFTIQRNGTLTEPQIERPSGFVALDLAAHRAVAITTLPPLPAQFPNPTLTVRLTFNYQR